MCEIDRCEKLLSLDPKVRKLDVLEFQLSYFRHVWICFVNFSILHANNIRVLNGGKNVCIVFNIAVLYEKL